MSEIETSKAAVDRLIFSGKRPGKVADITATLRALQLERDALAARVDACEPVIKAAMHASAAVRVTVMDYRDEAEMARWAEGVKSLVALEAALAAWRAAAAKEAGDG
jgi:tryptophan 2,3-dioxygenase